MDEKYIKNAVEAMLYAAGEPLQAQTIADILDIEKSQVHLAVEALKTEYEFETRGIHILILNDKYQMTTNPLYGESVQALFEEYLSSKLSQASLETLSIVAYKQPVTRPEVEAIRGVNSTGCIRNLCDRGLIAEAGKKDAVGRPLMYRTTEQFLIFAGISSIEELPDFEEFQQSVAPQEEFDSPPKENQL